MAHEHLVRKKLYNPLSGKELKELIMKDIEKTLDDHGYFRNNLTYPNVHFVWSLQVRSFPNEPSEFTVELEEAMRTQDWKHDPLKAPEEVTFEGGEEITQPDKTRKELEEKTATPGNVGRAVAASREDDPDSDAYQPKSGRMVRVKTDAAGDFDFSGEKF